MAEPVYFNPNYSEWRRVFNNEPHYTRRQMAEALQQKQNAHELASRILGVHRVLPNGDVHALVLGRVDRTEEGIFIIVK